MDKFMDSFMAAASKVGSQRHMAAIRDSFATLIPLLIAGSVAVLINSIPGILNNIGSSIFKKEWNVSFPAGVSNINGGVWWGTFALITAYIVFLLAYNLARSYETNLLGATVVAFASYIAVASTDSGGWTSYAGATGLLLGMVIAICAVEIFRRLYNVKALLIKMPDGVPPAVSRSFAALLPGMFTIFIFGIAGVLIQWIAFKMGWTVTGEDGGTVGKSAFALVNTFIQEPLSKLSNSLWTAIIVALLVHLLWVFGLHGPNILEGPIQTIFIPNMEANAQAFDQMKLSATEVPYIVTKPFLDCFVYLGGSGATLGLLIAIFMVGRSKALRTTSNVSVGPGAFNINEPVIFGLPIVLNPIFAIPFILTPVILTCISYAAMALRLVGRTVVFAHWAMPPILSGFITTGGDIRGSILQIINIAISVFIYIPFVMAADRQEIRKEKALESKA